MKYKIAILTALLAAALALPSLAGAPDREQSVQAPAWRGERPAAPLLFAQNLATCELDGRKVPQGMNMCREGNVWTCNRNGSWQRTGKAC